MCPSTDAAPEWRRLLMTFCTFERWRGCRRCGRRGRLHQVGGSAITSQSQSSAVQEVRQAA